MSWMPSADPILGDKRSCDTLELVVIPRVRDLGGGFAVRHAMPDAKRQLVGPFIFFDQMGPVQFLAGQGMDTRRHSHIGLATVTYLFDGCVMHRDSEGNAMEITPGAMNLMTPGAGLRTWNVRPQAHAKAMTDCLGSRVGGDRLPIWLVGGRPGRSQIEGRIIRRPPMSKPTSPTQMQDLSATLVSLIANIAPSVVSVHSNRSRSTGFAWRPGLIVTADEALSEEGELAVTFGGQPLRRSWSDVTPRPHRSAPVDRSELRPIQLTTSVVAPGVLVTAVGAEESTPTAAFGVVSRAAGPWRSLRGGEIDARIELDLRLRRTAEGGLVLDMTGQAVGMAGIWATPARAYYTIGHDRTCGAKTREPGSRRPRLSRSWPSACRNRWQRRIGHDGHERRPTWTRGAGGHPSGGHSRLLERRADPPCAIAAARPWARKRRPDHCARPEPDRPDASHSRLPRGRPLERARSSRPHPASVGYRERGTRRPPRGVARRRAGPTASWFG